MKRNTHPCLRVWGECKFGPSCQYLQATYDLCLHFAKGYCSQGRSCPFSHDPTWGIPEYGAAPTHDEMPVCIHWTAGHCRNGAKCPFGHPEAPQPAAPKSAKSPPRLSWSPTQGQSKGKGTNGAGRAPPACKFFMQGLCNKGLQCPFLHPETNEEDLIRPAANDERAAKRARLERLQAAAAGAGKPDVPAVKADPVQVYISAHKGDSQAVVLSRPEELRGKLSNLRKLALQGRLRFLVDFDQTITYFAGNGPHGRNQSTHFVMESCYREELQVKAKELVQKYYPKEVDPTLSMAEKVQWMEKWTTEAHALAVESGVTMAQLRQGVADSAVRVRERFEDFLQFCSKHSFPVLVFSAGIADVAKEIFRQKLKAPLPDCVELFANKLLVGDGGRIVGFHQPVQHVFNKRLSTYFQATQSAGETQGRLDGCDWIVDILGEDVSTSHKNWGFVCIGDSLGDADIVDVEVAECIKIGFLNTAVDTRMESFREKFDIVLTGDGDFQPVLDVCYVGCDLS
eukprot:GGOE01018123.1.p1 GENE.GGOE01018123.1~~GGOE01018123.1.p1  ORF type:complete len:512 (+),score=140.33 GGOE01018123.1:64-1599(+)